MVLYVIGLGLCDEKDITLRGLEIIKKCEKVYLDSYTSFLTVDKTLLDKLYGKEIIVLAREDIESDDSLFLIEAKTKDIAFLVPGDPYSATTHSIIHFGAKAHGVKLEVVHNASVITAVAKCGIQAYGLGQIISVVFTDGLSELPTSFYYKILDNLSIGLHTLCLLDLKIKERSNENIIYNRKIYEPDRIMDIGTAIKQMLLVEKQEKKSILTHNTMAVGLARIGTKTEVIKVGTLKQLEQYDFGPPLHSIIILGKMHIVESDLLCEYALDPENFKEYASIHVK